MTLLELLTDENEIILHDCTNSVLPTTISKKEIVMKILIFDHFEVYLFG